MGCDVHLYAETQTRDGSWIELLPEDVSLVPVGYVNAEDDEPDEMDGWRDGGWYTDRNYALFALLADVRNRTPPPPTPTPENPA